MKYLFIKNIRLLKTIISFEYKKWKFKAIFLNVIFPYYIRQNAYYCWLDLIKHNIILIRWKRNCLLSGRQSYLFKQFKLSRMSLKMNLTKAFIQGLKKNSW